MVVVRVLNLNLNKVEMVSICFGEDQGILSTLATAGGVVSGVASLLKPVQKPSVPDALKRFDNK